MIRSASTSLLIVLICFGQMLSLAHAAPPSASDRATARELAREAHQALLEGRYQWAEDRFRRASELVPAPTLQLGTARSLVGQERLAEAHETYRKILRADLPDEAPAAWRRAVILAQEELATIEKQLAWLTIETSIGRRASAWIDGKRLTAEDLGERIPLRPGEHQLRISAKGFRDELRTIELEPGESLIAQFNLEPQQSLHMASGHAPARVAVNDRGALPPGDGAGVMTWTCFGVGLAGVVVGSIAGMVALDRSSALQEGCNEDACPSSERDTLRAYRAAGTVSTVGFVAGGAGLLTALGLHLTRSPAPGATGASQSVRPVYEPTLRLEQTAARLDLKVRF